ncbi:MAG: hypothetical protein HC882_08275, partial [Acidobacteria bacterium]|nr:hypothetical protein [Acidobacteriota bacterium]
MPALVDAVAAEMAAAEGIDFAQVLVQQDLWRARARAAATAIARHLGTPLFPG